MTTFERFGWAVLGLTFIAAGILLLGVVVHVWWTGVVPDDLITTGEQDQ